MSRIEKCVKSFMKENKVEGYYDCLNDDDFNTLINKLNKICISKEEINKKLDSLSQLHTKKSIDEMIEFICWLREKVENGNN